MAEGDTILRAARRLGRALAGETVRVRAPNPRGRATGVERLDGMTVREVRTLGKNLVFDLGELALHSHLGMSGSWHVYAPGERWSRPARSAWAVLATEGGVEAAQFGGPTLRVLRAGALRRDPVLARVGPDLLAPGYEAADSIRVLRADPDRGLGDALLDQGKVAGIGNIFKSEACFAARTDPWRAVGELDDEELARVLRAARELMLAAAGAGRRPPHGYQRGHGPRPPRRPPIHPRGNGHPHRGPASLPG